MSTCKYCGNSDAAFSIRDGLCDTCHPVALDALLRDQEILEESLDLIETSENVDTKLARCDTALQKLDHLAEYVDLGLVEVNSSVPEVKRSLRIRRRQIAREYLTERESAARKKLETLVSTSAKINLFTRIKGEIQKYEDALGEAMSAMLYERVDGVINHIRLSDHVERAIEAEARGNRKKALNEYLSALRILRSDDVPDEYQPVEISAVHTKIAELKGFLSPDPD